MRQPIAFLLVRIDTKHGCVIDARIYSERNPSQMFGDYCFAEVLQGFGNSFSEAKQDIINHLKSSSLMWSWLRKFYKDSSLSPGTKL